MLKVSLTILISSSKCTSQHHQSRFQNNVLNGYWRTADSLCLVMAGNSPGDSSVQCWGAAKHAASRTLGVLSPPLDPDTPFIGADKLEGIFTELHYEACRKGRALPGKLRVCVLALLLTHLLGLCACAGSSARSQAAPICDQLMERPSCREKTA